MKTHIIAVIDCSGSMGSIASEASSGFNEFVKQQLGLPGEAALTLIEFDTSVQVQYRMLPLNRVPTYHLRPRGMTALLDAIGEAINIGQSRDSLEAFDQVVVCILTDGAENASKRFNKGQINALITERQVAGWSFVFLAANQDAFATARSYGISEQYTANFSADRVGTQAAYASMTASVAQVRGVTY